MIELILSLSISGAALILSVLSPFLTAVINARAQRKEREDLFYWQHKAEIFEEYLQNTGRAIQCRTSEAFEAYGVSFGKMLLYAGPDLNKSILSLDAKLHSAETNNYELTHRLNAICESLHENFPRLIQNGR